MHATYNGVGLSSHQIVQQLPRGGGDPSHLEGQSLGQSEEAKWKNLPKLHEDVRINEKLPRDTRGEDKKGSRQYPILMKRFRKRAIRKVYAEFLVNTHVIGTNCGCPTGLPKCPRRLAGG